MGVDVGDSRMKVGAATAHRGLPHVLCEHAVRRPGRQRRGLCGLFEAQAGDAAEVQMSRTMHVSA